ELFAEAAFFKGGNHENGLARARNDEAYEAFAQTPANPREVVERSAGGEEKRVVVGSLRGRAAGSGRRISHEALRVFDALTKFVGSDGVNAAAERLQGRESRWQSNSVSLFDTGQPRRKGNGGGRHMEEMPPRDLGTREHVGREVYRRTSLMSSESRAIGLTSPGRRPVYSISW